MAYPSLLATTVSLERFLSVTRTTRSPDLPVVDCRSSLPLTQTLRFTPSSGFVVAWSTTRKSTTIAPAAGSAAA